MHFAELNDDVLLRILDHLETPSLHQFTLSCRGGRALAMPFLLREVTLRHGWAQILAFCQFVLADAPYRAPLIRVLRLSSRHTVKYNKGNKTRYFTHNVLQTLPLLRDVLEAACNLHTISTSSTLGVVMTAGDPGIQAALLQAPKLAYVVVDPDDDIRHVCHGAHYCSWERWTARQVWFRLISSMRGLRAIELSAVPGASLHVLLETHKESLERLVMRGEINPVAFPWGVQWPKVRTLVLHNLAIRETLVRAFPNVSYLGLDIEPDGRVFYSHQTSSINTVSDECWPALDHVRGSSLGVMSMVLKCRVRRLDVDLTQMPQVLCIAPQYDLPDVLKTTQPAVLSLRMPSRFTTGYCRTVAAAVPKLKCLNLDIYQDNRVPCDARDVLTTFLPSTLMGLQSLVYLSIRMDHPSPLISRLAPPMCSKEDIVWHIAACLPSLQYLELSWEEIGWERSWWRKVHVQPSSSIRNILAVPISSSFGLEARARYMSMA